MGLPPVPAPVSLVTAIPCPPVALFGARCAMSLEAQMPPLALPSVSLEAFTFCTPSIDLAHSSWQLQLDFGICCSSGSGFICNDIKRHSDHGVSTHYKQSIGNFKVETMQKCIEEIRRVESQPVPPGTKHPSRNEIVVSFGLSLSSVSSDIAYLMFF